MPIILSPLGTGQGETESEFISPGSGEAVPAGLEAILEYEGLFLNDLTGIEKYRLTEIDGLHDADVRDSREVNPAYHGETAFDAYYGGRTITLTGRIEAFTNDKMRDMQQALRAAFGSLREEALIFRTDDVSGDHQIFCRKIQSIAMREAQGDFRHFRDFQITLRASNPRITSVQQQLINVDANSTPVESANGGNFLAQPIFQLDGPLTNAIVHYYDQYGTIHEQLILNGTIPNGSTFTVDIAKRTIRDEAGVNRFDMLSLATEWPEIRPGAFSFELDATGTGANSGLTVIWWDTWL